MHVSTVGRWLDSPESVFSYMANHINTVFPFSTGGCTRLCLGEKCDFHPVLSSDDYLHVQKLGMTSFTLEVANWCQDGIFGDGIAGDLPGSTIRFAINSYPDSIFGFRTCSGKEDVLLQQANTRGSSPLTNPLAPSQAALTWNQ